MPLRIIPASQPMRVETIVFVMYAPPGTGKTSLGFSAHAPLLLDTDNGAYRSAFRKDTAEATSWLDISGIAREDLEGYRTLVLDTSGRALDLLSLDIIAANPKHGRGGALTLQGYGELKSRFTAYLNHIRSFGLDVVLIAHSDEKQQGDEIVERIDMQGGSKQEVYKSADCMARLGIVNGKRTLTFSPTETRFGKDPANIGAVEVPDLHAEPEFLGLLIDRIKETLNAENEAQTAARLEAEAFAAKVAAAKSADEFTALIAEAGKDNARKRLLNNTAVAAGFEFDKSAGAYAAPAKSAA